MLPVLANISTSISSYFLADPFLQLPDKAEALADCQLENDFMRARYPRTRLFRGPGMRVLEKIFAPHAFNDQILADMSLPVRREIKSRFLWFIFDQARDEHYANVVQERRALREKLVKKEL